LKERKNIDPVSLRAVEILENAGVQLCVALALGVGANVDALFQGEGGSLPSTVILDYVYGVAAYKSWHSNRGDVDVMDEYHKKHYAPRASSDDTDDASEPDEPSGSECKPSEPRKPSTRTRRRDESDLAKAMDELNVFLMHIHGITPEEAAERRQKEIDQEERAAQEVSRSKVTEWRKHMDV
jgi:hypothetical protein